MMIRLGAIPSSDQGLFLNLCLGITPGSTQRSIFIAGDKTKASHIQGMYLNPCAIFVAQCALIFLRKCV